MNDSENSPVIVTNDERAEQTLATQMPEAGNINKIRDILFGVQMRDYDRRFARLEERLVKEANDTKDETRRRLDAIEEYFRKEIESLSGRVVAEQNTRTDTVREILQSLKELSLSFDRKISGLTDATSKGDSDLRLQLLEQSKQMRDDMQNRYNELMTHLGREADELREDKTDRSALAEMFNEIALRLTNDFKLPKQVG